MIKHKYWVTLSDSEDCIRATFTAVDALDALVQAREVFDIDEATLIKIEKDTN